MIGKSHLYINCINYLQDTFDYLKIYFYEKPYHNFRFVLTFKINCAKLKSQDIKEMIKLQKVYDYHKN